MEFWNRQIKMAQYMLLGTVIVTALNVAFLLGNADLYISYCAALPYYLVWLGKMFDNGLYMGAANGEYTATGLVLAGVLMAAWLVLWWLSLRSRTWLKVGVAAVAVDLGILAIFALVHFSDPLSCLWEAVIHAAVIWEMAQGVKAWKQKEEFLARQAQTEPLPDAPAREEEYV